MKFKTSPCKGKWYTTMTIGQDKIIRMAKAIEFYENKYIQSIGTGSEYDYTDIQLVLERGILDVCQYRDSETVEKAMEYVKEAGLL